MNKSDFNKLVEYIVSRSCELKNKHTSENNACVEFACIFCQNNREYKDFDTFAKNQGKIVQDTPTGYVYLLDKPIKTISGPLKLLKIRKPDVNRKERGDADFNTNYSEFKSNYAKDNKFELIKRGSFEMLRLSDPNFDVMACFSSISLSKDLGL